MPKQATSQKKDNQQNLRPIVVQGARTHNLKNIGVQIPRNSLTVITGVAQESLALRLILFMQKGKDDMWKVYPVMPGNS